MLLRKMPPLIHGTRFVISQLIYYSGNFVTIHTKNKLITNRFFHNSYRPFYFIFLWSKMNKVNSRKAILDVNQYVGQECIVFLAWYIKLAHFGTKTNMHYMNTTTKYVITHHHLILGTQFYRKKNVTIT